MNFIATKHISNCGGLGIIEIDHTDNLVNIALVVGHAIQDVRNCEIYYEISEEGDDEGEEKSYIMWGASKHYLDEFMRVDY